MALPTRLISICRIRSGSVRIISGISPSVLDRDGKLLRIGTDAHQRHHVGQDLNDRPVDPFQVEPASFDLAQVEDVIDEFEQVLAVASNRAKCLDTFWWRTFDARLPEQHLREPQDGGHGSADFMAHVGQKLTLRASRRFRQQIEFGERLVRGFQFFDGAGEFAQGDSLER